MLRNKRGLRLSLRLLLVGALSMAGTAQAALIGVNERVFPDTFIGQIDSNYDSSTGEFTMTGRSTFFGFYRAFDGQPNDNQIEDGAGFGQIASFMLAGRIDNNGNLIENLNFSIHGAIPNLGIPYTELLAGSIYAFGFAVASPPGFGSQLMLYEMVGNLSHVTSGLDYTQGQTIAFIWQDFLFPAVGSDSDRFQSDFFSDPGSAGASSDLFVIPAPSSAWLMLAAALFWMRKCSVQAES